MNPPHPPPQQPPSATRKQNLILGPRPTPLRLNKDSVKIKKPPRAPPPHTAAPPPPPPQQPVIIYSISPKPIVVEASNFLTLVQQLTGRTTSPPVATTSTSGEAPPSPAARLAVYERTSPKEGEWRRREERERERQAGGILSPAPGNLPGISAEMFTTTTATMTVEGSSFMGMSELMSPFMNNYNMAFLQSPSALLFNNVSSFVSPSPSNNDFFNIFDL